MTSEFPTPGRRPGLYVHVPFCRTKCPYCDFASTTGVSSVNRYLDAVAVEAERWRGRFPPFATLYAGGGTPSVLGAAGLARLLGGIRGALAFAPGAETTVEANPDDVTPRFAEALRELGVDRVSLGAQSFDDAELAFLGRRHDAAGVRAAIAALREAGVPLLALDLIFGLPGQSDDAWRRSLDEATGSNASHLSCYALTVHPDTPFGRLLDAGRTPAAGDDRQRELFLLADSVLTDGGWRHYEISNYARRERDRSRHNTRYWDGTPYLGLGPAAHSLLGERRWWNEASVGDWLAAVDAGDDPVAGSELLGEDDLALERLMLGLRTSDGVPVAFLAGLPGGRETLGELVDAGLLVVHDDRAAPTPAGMLVADALPLRFARGS